MKILWRHLSDDAMAIIRVWLYANGINPRDVLLNREATLQEGAMEWQSKVIDDDGHIVVDREHNKVITKTVVSPITSVTPEVHRVLQTLSV